MGVGYGNENTAPLRVLFCFGVSQTFFDTEAKELPAILEGITEAFRDLRGRFGIQVLGAFDDDQVMVGPSIDYPWTGYVIASAPDYESVVRVCNIVRETTIGGHRLWRFLKIEARMGRGLFFITEGEGSSNMAAPMVRPPMSPARVDDGVIYVSGQVGIDMAAGTVPADFAKQTHLTFANLATVLDANGGSLASVFKTTVFITSRDYFELFNSIYREYFHDPFPARSTVVADLVMPELAVEIEAVARVES